MSEKCRVLMPTVEGSEPLFDLGRSSARRKPVWLLKIDASEMVTPTAVVMFWSNFRVLILWNIGLLGKGGLLVMWEQWEVR